LASIPLGDTAHGFSFISISVRERWMRCASVKTSFVSSFSFESMCLASWSSVPSAALDGADTKRDHRTKTSRGDGRHKHRREVHEPIPLLRHRFRFLPVLSMRSSTAHNSFGVSA
jgi:hypothetical protein